jgi:hypothetical protein
MGYRMEHKEVIQDKARHCQHRTREAIGSVKWGKRSMAFGAHELRGSEAIAYLLRRI